MSEGFIYARHLKKNTSVLTCADLWMKPLFLLGLAASAATNPVSRSPDEELCHSFGNRF
jgi:hypothetical protein